MAKQKPFPSSTESIHKTHCPFLHRHRHLHSPRFTGQPPLTRQPQPNCNLPCKSETVHSKLEQRTKKKIKSETQPSCNLPDVS